MNRFILIIFTGVLLSCQSEVNRPTIQPYSLNYQFVENKYSVNDGVPVLVKSNRKLFHLEIQTDSDNLVAYWTDKLPHFNGDTSEVDQLLNETYTDGFTAKFVLDEYGDIDSLANWSELKTYVDSISQVYYQHVGVKPEEMENLLTLTNLLQTKERLLPNLYKSVFAFHNLYAIDATFDDSLVNYSQLLTIDHSSFVSDATIEITQPNAYYVEYLVTSEYEGKNELSILAEIERASPDTIDLSSLRDILLHDTTYYMYNRSKQMIETLLMRRHMKADTAHFIHELILSMD